MSDLGVLLAPAAYDGRLDLSNELRGGPEVAAAAARALARRDPRARPALVVGAHYTTCAQLAFTAGARFDVACPSPRLDQFDFSAGGDGSQARGVDLLYVKDDRFPFDAAELYRCLDGVERPSVVEVRRARRVVRRFELQLCRRFDGLGAGVWPPPRRAPAAVTASGAARSAAARAPGTAAGRARTAVPASLRHVAATAQAALRRNTSARPPARPILERPLVRPARAGAAERAVYAGQHARGQQQQHQRPATRRARARAHGAPPSRKR
jgi:hypothetical protein